jgi:myo-inositol-1(or 4)-monophosphatase
VWVADPLDGTINDAHGSPLGGVMLALVEDGEPVLSVTDLPFLGMRLEAAGGAGVRLDGERVHVSDVPSMADAIVALGATPFIGAGRATAPTSS